MEDYKNEINNIMQIYSLFGFNVHSYPNPVGLWPNEQKTLVWAGLNSPLNNDWIEIGSFCGGSAVLLTLVMKKRESTKKLICVDRSEEYLPDFNNNLYKGNLYNYINRMTVDSYKLEEHYNGKPLDLAFIDGWHTFKHCLRDFEQVNEWLLPNSLVLFHDTDQLKNDTIEQYYQKALEGKDEWMKETVPNPDPHGQTYHITETCAFIMKTFNFDLVEIPDFLKEKNSVTILRKPNI